MIKNKVYISLLGKSVKDRLKEYKIMKQQAGSIRIGWVIEYKGKPWTITGMLFEVEEK